MSEEERYWVGRLWMIGKSEKYSVENQDENDEYKKMIWKRQWRQEELKNIVEAMRVEERYKVGRLWMREESEKYSAKWVKETERSSWKRKRRNLV